MLFRFSFAFLFLTFAIAVPVFGGTTPTKTETQKREHAARDQWLKQTTRFYVYNLDLTVEELLSIESSREKCSEAIEKIVTNATTATQQVSNEEFTPKIEQLLTTHEQEVQNILGPERLAQAKSFREAFNNTVEERFGVSTRFTAF